MNREERAAIAERMYVEDQLIIREIAEKLGYSRDTIWKDLKRRNVKMRPTPADYRNQRIAKQMVKRAEKRRRKEANLAFWDIERFLDSI